MSYSLCVFLDSRKHERISDDHPFYRFVEETLQHIIDSEHVLRYMANNQNESLPDEAAEKRRVQDIIQYLTSNCPTVSGSDSPSIEFKLVDTRSYSGCGKDRKRRKLARKHVYIQKTLIDAWVKARSSYFSLCLLRGFIKAVATAFMPENSDVKHGSRGSLRPAHEDQSRCSFERFLCEWNVWLHFMPGCSDYKKYVWLDKMAFGIGLCHVKLTGSLEESLNKRALLRLYVGDWTAFPPLEDVPFMSFVENQKVLHIWRSPPAADPKPRKVEITMQRESDEEHCCVV